jgi:repressor LexA
MEKPLKGMQANIYAFIVEYFRDHDRPPTNREIGEHVGVKSTGHVDYHLNMLEKKGYIARDANTARGIQLLQRGLRIEGTIAAGQPLDIFAPDQQDVLDLEEHTHKRNEFVLQVRGQSMIDDHISDGDYVLIDRDAGINNGDIIVATKKTGDGDLGAATLKRIYKETDRVRLQPANSQMDPIYVDRREWDRDWEVQGKVTAVYRRC